MISIYLLKTKFQRILRPIANGCACTGISANCVTVTAFILSCLCGAAVYVLVPQNRLWYLLIPISLFLRMALNAIDGMIAREHNQKTPLGAILNELGDILSDCAIYIPFLYILSIKWPLITIFSLLTVVSETIGIMGLQIGASRRYDGPMGKSDRAFVVGLLALISAYYVIVPKILIIVVIFLCILLIYTIYNRISGALCEVNK